MSDLSSAVPIVILGAGGFGREAADVVESVNAASGQPQWNLIGIVDDAPAEENLERLRMREIPYLGTSQKLISAVERPAYVIGIGSPRIRKLLSNRLDAAGFPAATLVHPDASIGSHTQVGEGTVILAGARVTTNITLGRHVHINPNATIGHDSVLGDFVSMNPSSSVSGDCMVGEGALIGVHGVVLNQLSIGAWSVVGGSACVVDDVPEKSVVVGVPAREMGVNHS